MKKLEDYEKDDWELIETLWNVNRELERMLGKWKPN